MIKSPVDIYQTPVTMGSCGFPGSGLWLIEVREFHQGLAKVTGGAVSRIVSPETTAL